MRGTNKTNVVMVADDDLFVRKVMQTALQGLAQIVEVTDGAQVLEQYKAHMPDIIFLDIHLPNTMGTDLIRPIVKLDMNAHIIMLSADSSESNIIDSKLRGSKGFLTKPFDKQRVLHIFNSCPTIKFSDRILGGAGEDSRG